MTHKHPIDPTPRRPGRGPVAFTLAPAGLLLAAVLGLGACASPPPTDVPMAVADAAVRRASSTATGEAAPDELRVATGKLADARAAIAKGEFERALRLAEQATVDAQVAELHAQAYRARQAAVESEAAARALREELNRKAVR